MTTPNEWTPAAARERLATWQRIDSLTVPLVRPAVMWSVAFPAVSPLDDLTHALDALAARDAEVAQLRAALLFYADPEHYEDIAGKGSLDTSIEADGGERARAALHPEGETDPSDR